MFENVEFNIIKRPEVLDPDFLPEKVLYRERELKEIEMAITPILRRQRGTNLFIHGKSGIGKTVCVKFVLKEFNEKTDGFGLYVNCWTHPTKYFIFLEFADQLGLSFTLGKSAEHVLAQIKRKIKKSPVVFVCDEIDKAKNLEFLYQLYETFPNSSLILVSNNKDFLELDPRISSRLLLHELEFKGYTLEQVREIIEERAKHALKKGMYEKSALRAIAQLAYAKQDIRFGILLLKEAALMAEKLEKKLDVQCVKEVRVKVKEDLKLNEDQQLILQVLEENGEMLAGKLYELYVEKGGKLTYRSFYRYIRELERIGKVKTRSTGAGFRGRSTIISISSGE